MHSPPTFSIDLALLLTDGSARTAIDDMYWKDIKVAIDVKDEPEFAAKYIAQLGRYARCMKLDQFDRNFSFILFVNQDYCRVLRWDTAACHMTPKLNHNDETQVTTLMEIFGRLASLDPETLGYDPHFSNAGRVLADQAASMNTTLTIKPCLSRDLTEVGQDGQPMLPSTSPTPDVAGPMQRIYLIYESKIHQDRGGNFSRSTIVWEALEMQDGKFPTGPVYIIKQNHQGDLRPHEASFYEKANAIEGVAHLVCAQELTHTRQWHDLVVSGVNGCFSYAPPNALDSTHRAPEAGASESNIVPRKRVWNAAARKPAEVKGGATKTAQRSKAGSRRTGQNPHAVMASSADVMTGNWILRPEPKIPAYERVLLRLVFRNEGESINQAVDAKELLAVAHDGLKGECAFTSSIGFGLMTMALFSYESFVRQRTVTPRHFFRQPSHVEDRKRLSRSRN